MYVLTADYTHPGASEIFVKSIKETGFCVLKNHPIDFQLVKELYIEWEDFFNSRSKFEYLYHSENKEKQDGFFPYLSENDLKEYYNIYAWGRYPKMLSPRTRTLFHQMSALAGTALNWIERHLPDEIKKKFSLPLSEMIQDSPRTVLRILYYPPLTGKEDPDALRAAPCEDDNLLTVLPAATTAGLQVKDTQGYWHDVEADSGAMVVHAGKLLQLYTDHYCRSATYRVVNPVGEERSIPRFSMPLFLYPRDEVAL